MNFFYSEVERTVEVLKHEKVILYPTDTIWGIGCDATSELAVEKVFEVKDRPQSKSLIVLLSRVEQLDDYVEYVPENVYDIIRQSQRPLSVIFPKSKNLAKGISADGSVCIRVCNNEFCKAVIENLGHPITSTSANVSGAPSAPNFADVSPTILSRIDYAVNMYRDLKTNALPSRIIKIHNDGSYDIIRS